MQGADVISYNSVVYMTIAASNYSVYGVTEDFVVGSECLGCGNFTKDVSSTMINHIYQKINDGRFDRLENMECIKDYSQTFQSHPGDLLLVVRYEDIVWLDKEDPSGSTSTPENDSAVFWFTISEGYRYGRGQAPYDWMCSAIDYDSGASDEEYMCQDHVGELKASATNWTLGPWDQYFGAYGANSAFKKMNGPIQYCLREKAEASCQVIWNLHIAALVTTLNALKVVLILYTALGIKSKPLMSLGDALASFLRQADPFTVNMCLASSKDIETTEKNFNVGAKRWKQNSYRWKDTSSPLRRMITFSA